MSYKLALNQTLKQEIMNKNQVLIIDDDEVLTEMLTEYLADDGYEVDSVHDGLQGLNAARTDKYDLVILDVMLPTLGGMEVLKRLREDNQTPVLMLTARGDDIDRILGLEIGADDYLPKPFNTRELVARMKAILRRADSKSNSNKTDWTIGDLHVDIENWNASYKKEAIELTTAEFRMLNALYEAKGTAVTREDLTQVALGRPMLDLERAIDTHMSNLRKKFKKLGITSPEIKSVRGIGYVMVEVKQFRMRVSKS